MSLSSLSNGGLAGIHTRERGEEPKVPYITETTISVSSYPFVNYISKFGVPTIAPWYPKVEGEIVMYYASPYTFAIPYVAVDIDGTLRWAPAFIYKQIVDKSTGEVV